MSTKLGMECYAYLNGASYASPNWGLIDNIKDLTLNVEKGEADVSTRANNGWRARVGTLKDGSVDFQMVHDPENAGYAALQAAFFSGDPVEMAILDGPIDESDSEGLRATFEVFNFSRSENLEEAVMTNVSLKVTRADNAPEYDDVASGLFD